MQDPNNPYSPPQHGSYRVVRPHAVQTNYMDASMGARFVNMFVDSVVRVILSTVIQVALSTTLKQPNELFNIFLSLVVVFGYYVVFETWLGRTPGKFLSRTKVVMADGSDLTLRSVMIRTVCRAVPFEVFSIFGSGRMWHDSWSGTRVVAVN